jgi:hypothetical protein
VTREPFSIRVLASARREIDDADQWWMEHRANRDAIRDEFRRFCELVAAFSELGTLFESPRVSVRRMLLPDIDYHVSTGCGPAPAASRCCRSGTRSEAADRSSADYGRETSMT